MPVTQPPEHYINLTEINNLCDSIISSADSLDTCISDINNASIECDKNALYINGKTYENDIDDVGKKIETKKQNIKNTAQEIKAAAQAKYNKLLKEYLEYLEELKREREREREWRFKQSRME